MYPLMSYYISEAVDAHTYNARTPEKAFRKFDGETPYAVHPIWCAMTIATEAKLSPEIRRVGFYTLLYHDVPEDTFALLPEDLSSDVEGVVEAVADMTFESSADEMVRVWDKSTQIRLFKMYDKTSNLINMDGWEQEKIRKYVEYALRLATDVESNYGVLNIHHILNGVLEKYLDP